MGKLITPSRYEIKGPWLLQDKELEELNEILVKIERKIYNAYEELVNQKASEVKFESEKENNKLDLNEIKEGVKRGYPFNKTSKSVVLVSKDGKMIKDESLLSLLKDKHLNDFLPSKLQIEIIHGPFEFFLDISSQYDGALEVNLKMDNENIANENIANDINYELKKWIKKYKPNLVEQIWSSWETFYILIFSFVILLIILTSVIKSDRELYKQKLLKKSEVLLNNGISDTEINEALQIILEIESGYVPKSFKPEKKVNKTVVKILLIYFFILIILSIRPKTTIGLGKKEWIAKFYKVWIYIVLIFIPISIIIPILINRIF